MLVIVAFLAKKFADLHAGHAKGGEKHAEKEKPAKKEKPEKVKVRC